MPGSCETYTYVNVWPWGIEMDPVGSPSKNGMTFLKPCQWTVCSSNRSGRWARPTFVSWIRNSFRSDGETYSLAQNSGAECWALFFRLNWSVSLTPLAFANPKM